MAFSGLRSVLARISFFSTGDIKLLRKAKRCIPVTVGGNSERPKIEKQKMGQIFELIADSALKKLDDYYVECHVCDKTDIDLFEYKGELQLENGEINDDIYAVCADCILNKNLSHSCDFVYIKTGSSFYLVGMFKSSPPIWK